MLSQAVYRSLLHLTWVDKFVDNIKTIFVSLYGDQLTKPHTTLVECHNFDEYFEQQITELDKTSANAPSIVTDGSMPLQEERLSGNLGAEPPSAPGLTYRGRHIRNENPDATSNESTPIQTPTTSRPSTPGSSLVTAKGGPMGKMSRRARKAQTANSVPASSGDESVSGRKKGGKPVKKGRKWDADGYADEDDDVQLDYSAQANVTSDSDAEPIARSSAVDPVDASSWGNTTKGKFVLKDLGDEVHNMLAHAEAEKAEKAASAAEKPSGLLGTGVSALGGLFRNVVGGRTLTKADLDKAMKGMEEHLLRKNVAREAAVRLCEGVEKELLGVKTGNFESIQARIQSAMEASLTKMLTPTSSLDLLREIDAVTAPSATSLRKARPYVMSIVGVNGVGKSTNLSKICFFLLQNKYRVLIAAGDTFRSGAVEQLAVHVRNLKELTAREGGQVELYQKGYGKDAATVAKDAVAHAAQQGFDVVLIDTAGRRHNDQRLMSSLEKFANFAKPDKILMVGEVSPSSSPFGFSLVVMSFPITDSMRSRLLSAPTLLRRPATSTRPLVRSVRSMASSSPSATPSGIWSARWSVSFTRRMYRCCSSESDSIIPIFGTSRSNGLSRSCSAASRSRYPLNECIYMYMYIYICSQLRAVTHGASTSVPSSTR